jgi:hydrogenase/urease accessory protein HupE
MTRAMTTFVVALALATPAGAHPLNPALLELRERGDGSCDVRWRVPVGAPINAPIHPELPVGWHVREQPTTELLQAGQSLSTRWRVDCAPAGLVGARLAVSGLDERRTDALLRVARADGTTLQTVLRPGRATFEVPPEARTPAMMAGYLVLGIRHILSGPDHLLFVLGLLLLVRGRRRLLWTVTAFTAGHSVTLSLAVMGVVRIPPRPIEVLIALSILVLALELARPPEERRLGRRPWRMAFTFGLLHGLGFAGALAQVGLPPRDIPFSLASFNLGIEIGQVAFLVVALMALRLWSARPLVDERWARALPAYVIGSLGAFFVLQRL